MAFLQKARSDSKVADSAAVRYIFSTEAGQEYSLRTAFDIILLVAAARWLCGLLLTTSFAVPALVLGIAVVVVIVKERVFKSKH